MFKSQEARIDSLLKQISDYFEANAKDWIVYAKDFALGIFNSTVLPLVMDYALGRKKLSYNPELKPQSSQKAEEEIIHNKENLERIDSNTFQSVNDDNDKSINDAASDKAAS